MHRNNPLKSNKIKRALPPSNLGPLNVVSFGFRPAKIQGDSNKNNNDPPGPTN